MTFILLLTSPNRRYRLRLANLVCACVDPIEVAELGTATLMIKVPEERVASIREILQREIAPQGAQITEEP